MGLRCLMGHDFGELQTERDRRERGEEVIVTIREFRECERCGERRVVSENKEVRSAVSTDRGARPGRADGADEPVSEPVPDPDPGPAAATEEFDDVSAEEDDGVILEDEPEEREPGEWPDDETADDVDDAGDGSEPTPWPEAEGEDEGYAAEPGDDEELEGVEFGSGLTPEAAATDPNDGVATDDGSDVVEATGRGEAGGFRRASTGPSPTDRQRPASGETELFCPECEFTSETRASSLRPGDICPDCQLGYLTERER